MLQFGTVAQEGDHGGEEVLVRCWRCTGVEDIEREVAEGGEGVRVVAEAGGRTTS